MNSLTYIHDFEKVRSGKKSVLARIFFDRKARNTHCFWMSQKQWSKLCAVHREVTESKVKGTIICVFDNDRFVWAGVDMKDFSDKDFLKEKFDSEWVQTFEVKEEVEHHVPQKINPENKKPDESLTRKSN